MCLRTLTLLYTSMYKTAFLDASLTCSVCVLPHEFSLIHLHNFLTALPRPGLGLILSCLALPPLDNAASVSVL